VKDFLRGFLLNVLRVAAMVVLGLLAIPAIPFILYCAVLYFAVTGHSPMEERQ
jgi:hypothetical protein